MKSKYTSICAILLATSIFVTLTACSASGKNAQNPGQGGTNQQVGYTPGPAPQSPYPGTGQGVGNLIGENNGSILGKNTPGNNTATPQPPMIRNMGFDMPKADNLVKQIGSIDGAGQIKVIVNGNTALVGYKPTGTAKDAATIKNTIGNKIKQADQSITNVVVSDSADVHAKISKLSDEIRSDRPGGNLLDRFKQIIQGIRPIGT